MNNRSGIFAAAIIVALVTGTTWATYVQEKKPRRITRVKRPTFSQRDWDGIYFENIFEQGLVGQRPDTTRPNPATTAAVPTTTPATTSIGFKWSSYIASDVIEDEVKSIEQLLRQHVTTPVKFKSEYSKARQSFSMLSMLFAIIREYDKNDVRWKKYAPSAQATFAKAAANARVGSPQSYQNAKRCKEDLTELVRGGTFSGTENASEVLQWPSVVDRSPIMERLQNAIETLKPLLASQADFSKNTDTIFHEASIVAAIGQVLTRPDMDEVDEEDYAQFSKTMSAAARELVAATRNQDFKAGSTSVTQIEQSCSNCHEAWR